MMSSNLIFFEVGVNLMTQMKLNNRLSLTNCLILSSTHCICDVCNLTVWPKNKVRLKLLKM